MSRTISDCPCNVRVEKTVRSHRWGMLFSPAQQGVEMGKGVGIAARVRAGEGHPDLGNVSHHIMDDADRVLFGRGCPVARRNVID
mmetsp:Transcript_34952/g.107874  ORF Transcript_34952/g.107874 Transcript_34952/m.107874 type:complete len:85 (-) Transcript_34952:210-464(-)